MKDSSFSRRAFLAAATTTALAVSTRVNAAKVVPKKKSPNEVVRVGLIGLGGRCADIVANAEGLPNFQIAACCDCFKPRVDSAMSKMGEKNGWKPYLDFREMLEKEKLDGVMVETTTHARAWLACWCMEAGVDAYIEKPMCLTIEEGRHMVRCARQYKRVTQVGTQQRSMPLNNWASDLVINGALGKLKTVYAPNFVAAEFWKPMPEEPMPEGGTEGWWNLWTNQAELRPYHSKIHRGWSLWRDYDGGGVSFGVTGWGTHSYDQVQRGMGTDETGPVEVVLEEPMHREKAGEYTERTPGENETGRPYYAMVKGLEGNRGKVSMKYANGVELKLHLNADNAPGLGCVFEGEKGKIEINRDMIWAEPLSLVESKDRPPALKVPETQPHIQNWADCIRSRKKCTADIEYGQRSSTVCYLVNIARDLGKVGEVLKWDPKAERFTNSEEGNKMLAVKRREGFELPKVSTKKA